MSWVCVGVVVGLLFAVGIAVVVVFKTRSYAAQVTLATLLIPPAVFCLFGFLATFEPLEPAQQWPFRIGYGVIGLGLVATSVTLLICRPRRDAA